LLGCSATGPIWRPQKVSGSGDALVVVYRYSGPGGGGGSWVSTRLEVNGRDSRRLPDDSFVVLNLPAGDIMLSATPMLNLHYSSEHRITLKEKVAAEETAYFSLVSVFGNNCNVSYESVESGAIASDTYHPWPGGVQSTCFQRVPESIALKELKSLRQAD
jgi:hypothetical protein